MVSEDMLLEILFPKLLIQKADWNLWIPDDFFVEIILKVRIL